MLCSSIITEIVLGCCLVVDFIYYKVTHPVSGTRQTRGQSPCPPRAYILVQNIHIFKIKCIGVMLVNNIIKHTHFKEDKSIE